MSQNYVIADKLASMQTISRTKSTGISLANVLLAGLVKNVCLHISVPLTFAIFSGLGLVLSRPCHVAIETAIETAMTHI